MPKKKLSGQVMDGSVVQAEDAPVVMEQLKEEDTMVCHHRQSSSKNFFQYISTIQYWACHSFLPDVVFQVVEKILAVRSRKDKLKKPEERKGEEKENTDEENEEEDIDEFYVKFKNMLVSYLCGRNDYFFM